MDPVTTAIIAALTSEAAKGIAKKSYQALRSLLAEKKDKESEVVNALESLESKPDSKGRQTTLDEEIVSASLHQDDQVKMLAQQLLDILKLDDNGKRTLKQYNAENMVVVEGSNYGDFHFHSDSKKKSQKPSP